MANSQKFNKTEEKKFESGGEYSTPHQREVKANANDFLDQKDRKYPYKINGRPSRHLLMAAVKRAKQFGHGDIAKRAQSMLDDLTD